MRSARGHIVRYVRGLPGAEGFVERLRDVVDAVAQWQMVHDYWSALAERHERLPQPHPCEGVAADCQSAPHSGSARTS